MPATHAGDVFCRRYRLTELLSEAWGGSFWRAHDQVLGRSVAMHLLPASDPRAAGMLRAARAAAGLADGRVLRVLDADECEGSAYVVNEWGEGRSLDVILATEGALAPRRAAWICAEVAASVAAGHDQDLPHGRLTPESVLLDMSGNVRLIGYAVDAALHDLDPVHPEQDVTDLAALLYAALTERWPGVSRSALPAAPTEHAAPLRPRRVRAGIPRPLDQLCDQVLGGGQQTLSSGGTARTDYDLTTARGIGDLLAEFVGDTAGMAAAETARLYANGSLPAVRPEGHAPGSDEEPGPGQEQPREASPEGGTATGSADTGEDPGRPDTSDVPTEAGLPIFHEDDELSWLPTAEPGPPEPVPTPPPQRPLFAPEPPRGGPARLPQQDAPVPEPGPVASPGPPDPAGPGRGGPPADEEPAGEDQVPGRSWLRLAGGVGVAALVLLVLAFVVQLGRDGPPLGLGVSEEPSSPPANSQPQPIADLTASDVDPQGDTRQENPDLTSLAVDGDPETAWRTKRYFQDFGPDGLKTGVGLTVDLGTVRRVREVELRLVGSPTSFELYLGDTRPDSVGSMTPLTSATAGQQRSVVRLTRPTAGRYLTIWLTSLPAVDGGYRAEIAEVVVRG